MLLLQIPSLRRKHGSLTTDSSESCLMMLFSLSVFRFWYISWLRSWRKWLTLGLVGLPGRPPVLPRPWAGLVDMDSSPPLARSRQQLQQSRPMGERQSLSDISENRWMKKGEGAQVQESQWRMTETQVCEWQAELSVRGCAPQHWQRGRQEAWAGLVYRLVSAPGPEGLNGRLSSSLRSAVTLGHSACFYPWVSPPAALLRLAFCSGRRCCNVLLLWQEKEWTPHAHTHTHSLTPIQQEWLESKTQKLLAAYHFFPCTFFFGWRA